MTMMEIARKSVEERAELRSYSGLRGNVVASVAISYIDTFFDKEVEIYRGRKIPLGTRGQVFWMGSYCNSPYGDPWGIYTTYRVGTRTGSGEIYWTDIKNIRLV